MTRDILSRRYDILSQRAPDLRAWLEADDPYHEIPGAAEPDKVNSLGRSALARYDHILAADLEYGIETPPEFVRLDALTANLHAASQLCYDLLQMPERMARRQVHDMRRRATHAPPPPATHDPMRDVMSDMIYENRQKRYEQLQRLAPIDPGIDHGVLTPEFLNTRLIGMDTRFRHLLDVQSHADHQPMLSANVGRGFALYQLGHDVPIHARHEWATRLRSYDRSACDSDSEQMQRNLNRAEEGVAVVRDHLATDHYSGKPFGALQARGIACERFCRDTLLPYMEGLIAELRTETRKLPAAILATRPVHSRLSMRPTHPIQADALPPGVVSLDHFRKGRSA